MTQEDANKIIETGKTLQVGLAALAKWWAHLLTGNLPWAPRLRGSAATIPTRAPWRNVTAMPWRRRWPCAFA